MARKHSPNDPAAAQLHNVAQIKVSKNPTPNVIPVTHW